MLWGKKASLVGWREDARWRETTVGEERPLLEEEAGDGLGVGVGGTGSLRVPLVEEGGELSGRGGGQGGHL